MRSQRSESHIPLMAMSGDLGVNLRLLGNCEAQKGARSPCHAVGEKGTAACHRLAERRAELARQLGAFLKRYARLLVPPIPGELERSILAVTPEHRLPWATEALEKLAHWRDETRVARSELRKHLSQLSVSHSDQSAEAEARIQSHVSRSETQEPKRLPEPDHNPAEHYDTVISFASEDSTLASLIAKQLTQRGLRVFPGAGEACAVWEDDVHERLSRIYFRSYCCVILISSSYIQDSWTAFEMRITAARSRTDSRYRVVPIRKDDTPVPEDLASIRPLDLRESSMSEVVDAIEKTARDQPQSFGPLESKAKRSIHLIPREDGWAVKKAWMHRASRVFSDREEALMYGKQLASKTPHAELVVHRHDGSVADTLHPE
jgi:hypothetical protein